MRKRMLRPEPPSLEEGEWAVPAKPIHRKKRGVPVWAVVAAAAAAAVAQLIFVLQMPLLAAVEGRVAATGVACLSPLHVWGVNVSAVSFARHSMVGPRLVTGEGRVAARETSTLCPAAPARLVTRYERVTVDHVTPPWPWRRTARLEGEAAVCLQHMLDLFKGTDPC